MLTTIEQAKEYFYDRCKAWGISDNDTYELWINTKNIMVKAFGFIDDRFCTDAFLETTCNAIVNAWQIGEYTGIMKERKEV